MEINNFSQKFRQLILDGRIQEDIFNFLQTEGELIDDIYFVTTENFVYKVPLDTELEIISCVLQVDIVPNDVKIRVVVAVGGVEEDFCGLVIPKICTAKLHYDKEFRFRTIDFPYY